MSLKVNLYHDNYNIEKIRQNYQHQNAPFNGNNLKVAGGQPIEGVNGVEPTGYSGGYNYSVPKINDPSLVGGSTGFNGQRNADGSPAVVGGKFLLDPMRYYG